MLLIRLKASSITDRKVSGDRVYLGTALGNLSIYDISRDDNCNVEAKLISTKSLGKKAVEQLGFVKDISSLVALSGVSLVRPCLSPLAYGFSPRLRRNAIPYT